MKPTRLTQPYRQGAMRPPGAALTAMLRGRDSRGFNPADTTRAAAMMARAGERQRGRAARGKRPVRGQRPPR